MCFFKRNPAVLQTGGGGMLPGHGGPDTNLSKYCFDSGSPSLEICCGAELAVYVD